MRLELATRVNTVSAKYVEEHLIGLLTSSAKATHKMGMPPKGNIERAMQKALDELLERNPGLKSQGSASMGD